MKYFISAWLLIMVFSSGSSSYTSSSDNSVNRKHNLPEISLKHLTHSEWINISNTKLFEFNNKDIEMQYRCSVSEGVSLPANSARGGHAAGIIDGNIIVAGGTNWSKDKTTKYWLKNSAVFKNEKWIEGPDLPKPLSYAMYGTNNIGLYIAGGTSDGKSNSREVYLLRSLNKKEGWKILPQLPKAVAYGAGVIFKNKFFIACGSIENEQINNMWCLDTDNIENGWKGCNPIPGIGRLFPAFIACEKYLYLIGGLDGFSPLNPLNDIYRYNPNKNEWKRLKDLPLKGYAWVGQSLDDNHLLLTGRADGTVHDGIWIVNLKNSLMKKAGNLVVPSTTAPLIKIRDNCFWLIGGEPDANKNRTEKVSVIILNRLKGNNRISNN